MLRKMTERSLQELKYNSYFIQGCLCKDVLPPLCNLVYSNIQNLSSNIMHSKGHKPILN